MSVTNAASLTYHRQKPLRGRPGCACGEAAGQSPGTPGKRRKPFVLPEPTNPDGDIEQIRAEILAKYPDFEHKPWEEIRNAIQSGTSLSLSRDS